MWTLKMLRVMGWNPCGYDLKISPSRLTRDYGF